MAKPSRTEWLDAIAEWRYGNPERLRSLLAAFDEIPPEARAFLADLAAGKAQRKRGKRSTTRPPATVQALVLLARLDLLAFDGSDDDFLDELSVRARLGKDGRRSVGEAIEAVMQLLDVQSRDEITEDLYDKKGRGAPVDSTEWRLALFLALEHVDRPRDGELEVATMKVLGSVMKRELAKKIPK